MNVYFLHLLFCNIHHSDKKMENLINVFIKILQNGQNRAEIVGIQIAYQ